MDADETGAVSVLPCGTMTRRFSIPVRGNERETGGEGREASSAFPIPMKVGRRQGEAHRPCHGGFHRRRRTGLLRPRRAQLLQHGLLRVSFIPPRPIRELRDLTRQRRTLVGERSSAVKRIQKVLEDCNIKPSSVATDVMGASGRDMIQALIAGEQDPLKLATLARGRLQGKARVTAAGAPRPRPRASSLHPARVLGTHRVAGPSHR